MQLQGTLFSPALTRRFLEQALELAEQHVPGARKTLEDQGAGTVKHVAAAGIVRLPGLLRAIRMLLEAGLGVEAHPPTRAAGVEALARSGARAAPTTARRD